MGNYCEALKRYAQALECYEKVRKDFPKHWVNRARKDRPAYIQERIFHVTRALRKRR